MQYRLFALSDKHGGGIAEGKRKVARPIAVKRPMHLVMRSAVAKNELVLTHFRNRRIIENILSKYSFDFKVKIYQLAIVQNHIHLIVKPKTRKGFQDFLRVVTGQIAQKVTRAMKGKPFGKFWTKLSFTRLMTWGRDFYSTRKYLIMNDLEAQGIIPYQKRRLVGPTKPGS